MAHAKNLLLSCSLFFSFSGHSESLKIVPDIFTAQPGGKAQFLIITKEINNNYQKITAEGLPKNSSASIACSGKQQANCKSKTQPDDLPVYFLNISIPQNASPGNYRLNIKDPTNPTADPVPVTLDLKSPIKFKHPGIFLDQEKLLELANLTTKASIKDQTLSQALKNLLASKYGSTTYSPTPHEIVSTDNSSGKANSQDLINDSIAAYSQALLWTITKKPIYANNAIKIMNSWSSTLNSDFVGSNRFNLAAWTGDVWPRAAEIIRYTYLDGQGKSYWKAADIERFKLMLNQRHIQFIRNGFFTSGNYGGNLINSQAAAFVNIGVFNDDTATFLEGISTWRRMLPAYIYMKSDGDFPVPPSFWRNNFIGKEALLGNNKYWHGQDLSAASIGKGGIAEETCRDLGHVIWGISALANANETANIQGFDLINESTLNVSNRERLAKSLEFNLKFLNNNDSSSANKSIKVPNDICHGSIDPGSSVGKGEVLFNNLANQQHLSLPQTYQYLKKYQPTGASYFMVWETLTHYYKP